MSATHANYASIICANRNRRRHLMQAAMPVPVAQNTTLDTNTDMELAPRAVLTLPDAPARLICLAGEIWLTRGREDHVLAAGESFAISRGDRVVLAALRHSRIRLLAGQG